MPAPACNSLPKHFYQQMPTPANACTSMQFIAKTFLPTNAHTSKCLHQHAIHCQNIFTNKCPHQQMPAPACNSLPKHFYQKMPTPTKASCNPLPCQRLLNTSSHYKVSELMSYSSPFNLLIQPSSPFIFTFLCFFFFSGSHSLNLLEERFLAAISNLRSNFFTRYKSHLRRPC